MRDHLQPGLPRPDPCIYSQRYLAGSRLRSRLGQHRHRLTTERRARGRERAAAEHGARDRRDDLEQLLRGAGRRASGALLVLVLRRRNRREPHRHDTREPRRQGRIEPPRAGGDAVDDAADPGHYCLRVDFEWLDDLIPDNNLGFNNLASSRRLGAASRDARRADPTAPPSSAPSPERLTTTNRDSVQPAAWRRGRSASRARSASCSPTSGSRSRTSSSTTARSRRCSSRTCAIGRSR